MTDALATNLVEPNEEEETNEEEEPPNEVEVKYVDIPHDAYNMLFLAPWGSQAFYFAIYTFVLKIGLFTFIAIDALETIHETKDDEGPSRTVLALQCLMLPVAVAMQQDLIATYMLLANVQYSSRIRRQHSAATPTKYYVAIALRGLDGVYSLFINFLLLLLAKSARTLFLNFAALQFLQTIDNLAVHLARDGFFTAALEEVAKDVEQAHLPSRTRGSLLHLDSVLFVATFENLLVAWFMLKIY
jgi:hypothetical protein